MTSANEADIEELNSRPLFIGSSVDVAQRHFSNLTPGKAFGRSQNGRFGKHGREFWAHVSDIYDWERALCEDLHFRPGIREIAAGIRIIIGDEFVEHIAAPHGFLENGKSFILSPEERRGLLNVKYLAMAFKGSGPPGQEDLMIVLLLMPNQHIFTFMAHQGTPASKKLLHEQAYNAMNKMLKDNTLSQLQWFQGKPGEMMKVTPGSNWENPYLTLEAFRVLVRESRRQRCEYEDWPHSVTYSGLPDSQKHGGTARDFWRTYLRGALGHHPDRPLMVDPTSSTQGWADASESLSGYSRTSQFSEDEDDIRHSEQEYRLQSSVPTQASDIYLNEAPRGASIKQKDREPSYWQGSDPGVSWDSGSRRNDEYRDDTVSSVIEHDLELGSSCGDDQDVSGLPEYNPDECY